VTKILLPQYATHSDPNGTPDYLHLGRASAEAEASTLDITFFAPLPALEAKYTVVDEQVIDLPTL
jgi:hypothetical protein